MSDTRFAIYHLLPDTALAAFGAAWLGWDVRAGVAVRQPDLPGLAQATQSPRRYGFHATLKPPFRLGPGAELGALRDAVARMARSCAPARADGLELARLGRFLALTLSGDPSDVSRVAATCVETLDPFRAEPDATEIARRSRGELSPAQQALLLRWGYPYVMEAFRFHMTLTGRLPKDEIAAWRETLEAHLPGLPQPFVLDRVALVGEREDGLFELIDEHRLSG